MSYEFYKILHFLGIMLLFTSLGGLVLQSWLSKPDGPLPGAKKMLAISHGVALLIIFVAGFGLMAKKGLMSGGWPLWIFVKLGVWLVLGAALGFIRRKPDLAKLWFFLVPILGAIAAAFAVTQPR